jgi:hypothetical protein
VGPQAAADGDLGGEGVDHTMPSATLRTTDWEHRLHVLSAWRLWRNPNTPDPDSGATYRAVLDGCAITVRALCYALDIRMDAKTFDPTAPNREQELLRCLQLATENQVALGMVGRLQANPPRCLLEVLFLGNRAVAHPTDGVLLDHKVGADEMTSAINTVVDWIDKSRAKWPALNGVRPDLFLMIV